IGSPEWAHTAAVYMRGWLNDEHGIGLRDIHWYQAGANEAGRVEKVELDLPEGVKLTRVNDKSLSEMIASGEIDCALIARPPNSFLQGHPDVVRLFPNYLEMEEAYYEQTKVWPIMHIIAIQRRVLEEHPWVARNLYNAFVESKRRSLERLLDPAVSRYPLAWLPSYARKMYDLFDGDPFPYGIEENRPTLEQFLRYTREQGIAHRHAVPEEIFPEGLMTAVRVYREGAALGVVPRPQFAHSPLAALGAAGRALQPRLAAVLHVAGEKIAARDPILTVVRGEGRNGAAGPGLRILPWHAAVLAALDQNLAHGGAGDGEVGLRRHLRSRLGRCGSGRVGLDGRAGIRVRKRGVELIGDAAAASHQRKGEQPRARLQTPHRHVP